MTQLSDTPTSQSAAARWTFYRRLGLLMRTRLDDEGTTLSLHDVAARTHGRVSVDQLRQLFAKGSQVSPDPVVCVLLAQAFDIDPDFFITDEAVADYISSIRGDYASLAAAPAAATLQAQACYVAAQTRPAEAVASL